MWISAANVEFRNCNKGEKKKKGKEKSAVGHLQAITPESEC